MTLQSYPFKSGVSRENTRYTAEGQWWDMDKTRFRAGTPEKIGGWVRYTTSPYLGVCRGLFNWVDLRNDNVLAIGTNIKLYGERGGSIFDITPIVQKFTHSSSPSTDNCIQTFIGTGTIRVNVTDPETTVGSYVLISGATDVGGISSSLINGEKVVTSVQASYFEFTVAATASSSASGGGTNIEVDILLENGNAYQSFGTGWGAGYWGGTVSASTVLLGANPFATTSGSGTVTVTQTAHGLSNGNYVSFSGAVGFAGIAATTFDITYAISNVTTNTYDITLPSGLTASATTSGGGSAVIVLLPSGNRGWGTAADTSAVSGDQIRLWSFDNFGENLIANVRGGQIYYWEPTGGFSSDNRAIPLSELPGASDTPLFSNVALSTDERYTVAFGSNPIGETVQDPLLIRWSNQEDPANWTPTATNTAGDIRIGLGSYIVGAEQTRQEILVWTDVSLHSLQYLGAPYVFNLQTLSSNVSLISPNAAITVNNVTYWMGVDKFYAYSGRVETLPCSLRRYVFSDINPSQAFQVQAGLNEYFGEVYCFYCSQDSVDVDKYVVYNYNENIWYFGTIPRSAWLQANTRNAIYGAGYDGYLYQQEVGNDDGSTIPASPITAYIESADFDIDQGEKFAFIKRIIPDVDFEGSTTNTPSVTYTLKAKNYPGATYDNTNSRAVTAVSGVVDQYTPQVWTRVRGRQAVLRVESTGLGVSWQIGTTRLDLRPDGRR